MTVAVSRALLAFAACCIGDHRREWASAMEAELEAAIDDGHPFRFALGCLIATLREMPAHREGRFALVNHAVALGIIIPIAASLISGVLPGFPFLSPGHADVAGSLVGSDGRTPLLNAYDRSALPALAFLVLLLAAAHLAAPWFLLDRDWRRVSIVARLNAATSITLTLFTGILFLDGSYVLLPTAGVAVETLAIVALSRWHSRISAAPLER